MAGPLRPCPTSKPRSSLATSSADGSARCNGNCNHSMPGAVVLPSALLEATPTTTPTKSVSWTCIETKEKMPTSRKGYHRFGTCTNPKQRIFLSGSMIARRVTTANTVGQNPPHCNLSLQNGLTRFNVSIKSMDKTFTADAVTKSHTTKRRDPYSLSRRGKYRSTISEKTTGVMMPTAGSGVTAPSQELRARGNALVRWP
mmetsp:Transcript_81823/g.227895  ORF Transcript_81823/g.227895 Transcript_81823/m.227895 type:complete len:200 (-) Transcript_81823:161-760(-)